MATQNIVLSGATYVDISTPLGLIVDTGYSFTIVGDGEVEIVRSATPPLDSLKGIIVTTSSNNFPLNAKLETLYARTAPNTSATLSVSEYVLSGGSSTISKNLGFINNVNSLTTFTNAVAGNYAVYVGASATFGTTTLSSGDRVIANNPIVGTPTDFLLPDFTVDTASVDSLFKGYIDNSTTSTFFADWIVGNFAIVKEDVDILDIRFRKFEQIVATVIQTPTPTTLRANFEHIYLKDIYLGATSTADSLRYTYTDQVLQVKENFNLFDTAFVAGDEIIPTTNVTTLATDFTNFTLVRGSNRGSYSTLLLADLFGSKAGFRFKLCNDGIVDGHEYYAGDVVRCVNDTTIVTNLDDFEFDISNGQNPTEIQEFEKFHLKSRKQMVLSGAITHDGILIQDGLIINI